MRSKDKEEEIKIFIHDIESIKVHKERIRKYMKTLREIENLKKREEKIVEKERMRIACEITRKWEKLTEDIEKLEKGIKNNIPYTLSYGIERPYRAGDFAVNLDKSDIQLILNNKKARLQELEKEWETFIKE